MWSVETVVFSVLSETLGRLVWSIRGMGGSFEIPFQSLEMSLDLSWKVEGVRGCLGVFNEAEGVAL